MPDSTHVGTSDHAIVSVTFALAARRLGLNTQSGFTSPPFHWPMLSLGLFVFESMWPPASCTAASPPLLNGTYRNFAPVASATSLVSVWSVSFDWLPPI